MLSPCSSTPTASWEPAPQWQVLFACSSASHPGRTAVGTESSSPTATPFHEWGGFWDPGCATTRGIHPGDSARCSRGGGNRLHRVRWGPWGARARAEAREWGRGDLMYPASCCVWRHWLSTVTVTGLHHPLFPSSVHWPDHHRVLTVVPDPAPSEFSSAGQGSSHGSVLTCWAPHPTRALWDEFTPITPSRTLPPSASIPPEQRAASASRTTVRPDRDILLTRLREVDGQRLTLDVARVNLMRELAVLEGKTLQATRLELEASQQRCQLLEDQLRRYRNSAKPSLQVVGDLQGICSSHALLLMPDRGRTSVYHLTQEDLLSLDISGRDPALSCERL